MRTFEKGTACHVILGQPSGSTVIAVAEPEPLERLKDDLKGFGFGATTERHGLLSFLMTEAAFDTLPSILLDHFNTYYRYEDHGPAEIKITDADGRVEYDDREDWDRDGFDGP